MRSLNIFGLALVMAVVPAAAEARQGRPDVRPGAAYPSRAGHVGMRNWGPRSNGRWHAGTRAPGGWSAYRPAARGYVLPSFWINPSFYIGNYASYGFSAPQSGYGWSRYYDDAVLTDRYGRVYDSVRGVDWDRYDGYADEDYSDSYGYRDNGEREVRGRDRDGGLGGALIGGAVGALAGGVIAGKGDHTEGAILGGVVGAIAGAAIDSGDRAGRGATRRMRMSHGSDRGPTPRMGYDVGGGRDGVTYDGQWVGTWTGSWDGGPVRTWTGSFEGDYQRSGADTGRVGGAHWSSGAGYQGARPMPGHMMHGGYAQQGHMMAPGYGWMMQMVPMMPVMSQPIVTTTVTEQVYYTAAPVRKRVVKRRVVRPRAKAVRCICR